MSLVVSLNGELVFLFLLQKLLFVQDLRSLLLQETHLSAFSVVFSQDWLLFFAIKPFGLSVFGGNWESESADLVFRHKCNNAYF